MHFILTTSAVVTCWSELGLIWSFLEGEAPRPTGLEELPQPAFKYFESRNLRL